MRKENLFTSKELRNPKASPDSWWKWAEEEQRRIKRPDKESKPLTREDLQEMFDVIMKGKHRKNNL